MQLSTQFDLDTGLYHIMCESHGRTAVAGPRILRGGPHPEVIWSADTEEELGPSIKALRAYFDALPAPRKGKVKSKATGAFSE